MGPPCQAGVFSRFFELHRHSVIKYETHSQRKRSLSIREGVGVPWTAPAIAPPLVGGVINEPTLPEASDDATKKGQFEAIIYNHAEANGCHLNREHRPVSPLRREAHRRPGSPTASGEITPRQENE